MPLWIGEEIQEVLRRGEGELMLEGDLSRGALQSATLHFFAAPVIAPVLVPSTVFLKVFRQSQQTC
jgi:hypothetical protein